MLQLDGIWTTLYSAAFRIECRILYKVVLCKNIDKGIDYFGFNTEVGEVA